MGSSSRSLVVWVFVVLLGLVVGLWISNKDRARREDVAREVAAEVSHTLMKAREAQEGGDLAAAERYMARAKEVLSEVGGEVVQSEVYAAMLVDHAALKMKLNGDQTSSSAGARGECAALLEEAWGVPELSQKLKNRIARDRGAIAVLDGDLEAAREWYLRAVSSDSRDVSSKEKLSAMKSHWNPDQEHTPEETVGE